MEKLLPLDYRIPEWDYSDLQERTCPVCKKTVHKQELIRPDDLIVRCCTRCGTYFISPAPSNQQLNRFYESYDQNHRRAESLCAAEIHDYYRELDPLNDMQIQEISTYLSFKDIKALDVGFGRAYFMFLLKKLGARTFGVELDETAVALARDLDLPDVLLGTILDLDDNDRFNLIIMNDFIEHPLEPLIMLEKASRLLLPEGLLVILTPNGDIPNKTDPYLPFRLDLEHMQYLTPEACIFIAHQIGLKVIHLETYGFPALDNIEKPVSKEPGLMREIRKSLKKIPGFELLRKIKRTLSSLPKIDQRRGDYHLFCIMQKPAI